MLNWTFSGRGEWDAMSDNGHFYNIAVCNDGTFDVSETPRELISHKAPCFDTLGDAKKFCQENEAKLATAVAVNAVAVCGEDMDPERWDGQS